MWQELKGVAEMKFLFQEEVRHTLQTHTALLCCGDMVAARSGAWQWEPTH